MPASRLHGFFNKAGALNWGVGLAGFASRFVLCVRFPICKMAQMVFAVPLAPIASNFLCFDCYLELPVSVSRAWAVSRPASIGSGDGDTRECEALGSSFLELLLGGWCGTGHHSMLEWTQPRSHGSALWRKGV